MEVLNRMIPNRPVRAIKIPTSNLYKRRKHLSSTHQRKRKFYLWLLAILCLLTVDRTQISSSEGDLQNGFGFSVPSQSMWPLDVEEGWATRDLASTIGSMTMSAPLTEITFGSLWIASSKRLNRCNKTN